MGVRGSGNRDHLASIDFSPLEHVTDAHRSRARAIDSRRTDRLPFTAPAGWESFRLLLSLATCTEGVSVTVLADESRPELIEASTAARLARAYDSGYHAELIGWTAERVVSEGIPAAALPSASEGERVPIGRDFPTAVGGERRATIAGDLAKVIVLSTEESTRAMVMRCGEVLSSVLLDATMAGLATCTLSHLTEVPASRHIVSVLTSQSTGSDAIPQVLVRIGSVPGSDPGLPRTPRRPLCDVLTVRGR